MPKNEFQFSKVQHHESVKKVLNKAIEDGKLTATEAEDLYQKWLSSRREQK